MTKPTPHGYDGVTEPGLTHDIEQWIKQHSHATLCMQIGKLWAYCDQLRPRVTKNEEQIDWLIAEVFKQHERLARLEDYIETLNADVGLHIPLEPRGPHD